MELGMLAQRVVLDAATSAPAPEVATVLARAGLRPGWAVPTGRASAEAVAEVADVLAGEDGLRSAVEFHYRVVGDVAFLHGDGRTRQGVWLTPQLRDVFGGVHWPGPGSALGDAFGDPLYRALRRDPVLLREVERARSAFDLAVRVVDTYDLDGRVAGPAVDFAMRRAEFDPDWLGRWRSTLDRVPGAEAPLTDQARRSAAVAPLTRLLVDDTGLQRQVEHEVVVRQLARVVIELHDTRRPLGGRTTESVVDGALADPDWPGGWNLRSMLPADVAKTRTAVDVVAGILDSDASALAGVTVELTRIGEFAPGFRGGGRGDGGPSVVVRDGEHPAAPTAPAPGTPPKRGIPDDFATTSPGDEPPLAPTNGGTAPAPTNGATQQSPPPDGPVWLTALVEDRNPAAPLAVDAPFILGFRLGARSTAPSQVASTPTDITFSEGETEKRLTVELLSEDFELPVASAPLTLRRDAREPASARFIAVPRHAGASTIEALLYHEGNFLHRLELTFDVGGAPASDVDTANRGRTAAAASATRRRDLSLVIEPSADGFRVTPHDDRVHTPVLLQLTEDELDESIRDVREALDDVAAALAERLELDAEEESSALAGLARAGRRLYQRLFRPELPSAPPARFGAWLTERLNGEPVTLQVVSSGFPVPWSLLYLDPVTDPSSLSWQRFVGGRHVVEQLPFLDIDAAPSTTMDSRPSFRATALFDDTIDEDWDVDFVATQRASWAERPGVAATLGGERAAFAASIRAVADEQLLYLYCHAYVGDPGETALAGGRRASTDDSYVQFTDGRVALKDLSLDTEGEGRLAGAPLVFINACESGQQLPSFSTGIVPYFFVRGARGVIGTECRMPARFAASWAEEFFDRFFAGGSIGDVVLELREHFLETYRNPFGLLYGLYCDTDTRVAPALPSRSGP